MDLISTYFCIPAIVICITLYMIPSSACLYWSMAPYVSLYHLVKWFSLRAIHFITAK